MIRPRTILFNFITVGCPKIGLLNDWNVVKIILKNMAVAVFESCFFMVEIDSTPSKTSKAPKIFKFSSNNLNLQKSLSNFIKILPKFP